ncbi:hypothetical protein HanRHA438_Chr05g0215691 [Helianthus annuus]|nr:hypothetical protein HanRHA438_Chr05g0215691 [Helianthus annuus]
MHPPRESSNFSPSCPFVFFSVLPLPAPVSFCSGDRPPPAGEEGENKPSSSSISPQTSPLSSRASMLKMQPGTHSPSSSSTQTLNFLSFHFNVTDLTILPPSPTRTPIRSKVRSLASFDNEEAWTTLPNNLPTESNTSTSIKCNGTPVIFSQAIRSKGRVCPFQTSSHENQSLTPEISFLNRSISSEQSKIRSRYKPPTYLIKTLGPPTDSKSLSSIFRVLRSTVLTIKLFSGHSSSGLTKLDTSTINSSIFETLEEPTKVSLYAVPKGFG